MSCVLCYEVNDEVSRRLEDFVNIASSKYFKFPNAKITKNQFLKDAIPDKDRPSVGAGCIIPKLSPDEKSIIEDCREILGMKRITNWYQMNGNLSMAWHTNSNAPGKRIYYTFSEGEAIFRYCYQGKIIDSYDYPKKWTRREFTIPDNDLLWHSIWTEKPRFSFGFSDC